MAKKNKFLFNIIFIFVMSIFVAYMILHNNFEKIIPIFKNMNLIYILLCFIITLLWQFFISISLTIFAKKYNKNYKYSDGFSNALVASLFNGITPSATGGQIAQLFIFKKQNIKTSEALSILWSEFIVYQSVMCIYGAILILLRLNYFINEYSNIFIFVILGFILNSSIIIILFLIVRIKSFQYFCLKCLFYIVEKFHLVKDINNFKDNINNKLDFFVEECNNIKKRKKTFLIAAILCIVRLTLYYLIPYIIFSSLNNQFDISLLFNVIAMSSFISIISNLIPIPGASGGIEATFIIVFSKIFNELNARSAVIIWRFFTYYLMMLIGFLVYTYYKFKEK